MAGGWKPGRGESLAERTRRRTPLPSPRPLRPTAEGRHCWAIDSDGTTLPGVLLEWRQGPSGWQGRVAYAVPGEDSARLIEEWLPADQLKRLDA